MGDGEEGQEGASASSESNTSKSAKSGGIADKLKTMMGRAKAPEGGGKGGEANESDVAQAADQWAPIAGSALALVFGLVVGRELRPDKETAQLMALPLTRIIMRHVDPLRTASADTYDASLFLAGLVVYIDSIAPLLAEKRQEKGITRATIPQANYPAGQPGQSGQQQPNPGGGPPLYIIPTPQSDAQGDRRYVEKQAANSGGPDHEAESKPASNYSGESIVEETFGIRL